MRPSGVVAVEEGGQHHGADLGVLVGALVCPAVLGGADKALGLPVGLRPVGPGVDVADAVVSQSVIEVVRSLAVAPVCPRMGHRRPLVRARTRSSNRSTVREADLTTARRMGELTDQPTPALKLRKRVPQHILSCRAFTRHCLPMPKASRG